LGSGYLVSRQNHQLIKGPRTLHWGVPYVSKDQGDRKTGKNHPLNSIAEETRKKVFKITRNVKSCAEF
jgi:hypothetical protein